MMNIKLEQLDKDIQNITKVLKNKYQGIKLTTTGINPGQVIISNPNDFAVTLSIRGLDKYILKIYTQYAGEYRVETNLGTKVFDTSDKAIEYTNKFISKYFEQV